LKIGILAVQGDFEAHAARLHELGTGDLFYGPVAPGKAEPQIPGDAPVTTTEPGAAAPAMPTTKPAMPMPAGNGKGMK
jgi:hypothetical protein